MATIVEKTETDGMINRFVLVGAGKVPASFGDQEEDFLVACDEEGCVQILNDYKCTLRIVSIDGKSPKELLKDFSATDYA